MLTSETIGPILKPNALQTSPRLERLDALTKWSESFVPTRKAFNNIALYGGTRSPANIKQIYANAIISQHKKKLHDLKLGYIPRLSKQPYH